VVAVAIVMPASYDRIFPAGNGFSVKSMSRDLFWKVPAGEGSTWQGAASSPPGRLFMFKLVPPSEPPPAPAPGADPFIDELVERAAAGHAGHVAPEELAAMKDELRMFLLAHPSASRIVDRARPRVARDRSHTAGIADATEPSAGDKIGGKAG
jgi:hypothetical protein